MSPYAAYVMPIGKYAGKTLAAIDELGQRDYIEWAARKMDNTKTRTAAAGYLATTAPTEKAPLISLPLAIAAHTTLSPGNKLVFAAIYTVAGLASKQQCRASNAEIARMTGLSEKHVKRSLEDLEGHGLITRVMRDAGHRDHIRVVAGGDDMSAAPRTSCTPWEEYFRQARREDVRNPIRGSIRRHEDEDGKPSSLTGANTAMDDYFWRKAPDRKRRAQPPDDEPELQQEDYTPKDRAEIQASLNRKPPWEE